LGKLVVSNCSYGIISNNLSIVKTTGSVCTGIGAIGYYAINQSSISAQRCYASFAGTSIVTLRFKQANASQVFENASFIHGQTFSTPDGRIRGTVWDWDAREKILNLAVRVGALEGGDPSTQR
jgi:hypothetical protein